MLTEIAQTLYQIRVGGRVITTNIPSRQIAEGMVIQLPADQRALAEIVPMTSDGRQVLLG